MPHPWSGVFPALTTQFHPDQSLDLDATQRHVEVLLDSGVAGLIMLGSLGENVTLEPHEKRAVMEMAIRTARGRVPVLSGIAETSTSGAVRYAREMEKIGADGVMLLPAMVYKSDPRETITHFRTVARATDLPIIVYNNPIAYGVDITPQMFAELADEKNLVAIKESSADVRRITDILNEVGDRYTIFTGVDDLALESIMLGAKGWIAGLVNAFPAENQYLWELAIAGKWEEAKKIYRWYMPLLHLDTHFKFIHYIKLAVQECGLGSETMRAPRLPLVGQEREAILKIIHDGIRTRPKIPKARGRSMSTGELQRLQVIDSHTGGEPTRVVLAGCPDLGGETVAGKMLRFRHQHDSLRSAIANEPRGSEAMVGAMLLPPSDPANAAAVFFFNNVGYLGMCGHGTIGLIATLAHLGRIKPGHHRIETPVGVVTTQLHDDGSVSVQNVPSYRHAKDVRIDVEGHGPVTGDIAWGGNWFFLVSDHGQQLSMKNLDTLTHFSWRIRQALSRNNITGRDGAEIDHIELFAPSKTADSQNFVLCPGKAYDRSPCGTGASAKLACLFADGKLREGQVWKQESIIGSHFEGTVHRAGDDLIPTIKGAAHITAESTLILDPSDPFVWGIRS